MGSARRIWLLLALLVAGCGGGPPSPEAVVRAWSRAVNDGDNETAASLFAAGAEVVQAGRVRTLSTRAAAVAWNAALPCSGELVRLATDGDTATATFVLGHRAARRCDGPGQRATTLVRVRDGKIVLWHQLQGPLAPDQTVIGFSRLRHERVSPARVRGRYARPRVAGGRPRPHPGGESGAGSSRASSSRPGDAHAA